MTETGEAEGDENIPIDEEEEEEEEARRTPDPAGEAGS